MSGTPSPPVAGPWRAFVVASLVLSCLPLVQGGHFVVAWWTERVGLDAAAQVSTFGRAWGSPQIRAVAAELDRVMPPGEPLLLTPAGGEDRSGRTRYFLFLADALHPRPVFVRQPRRANGTMVDYRMWIAYHKQQLDTDGSGLTYEEGVRREVLRGHVAEELAAYGVRWELTFAFDLEEPFAYSVLTRDGEPVAFAPDLTGAGAAGEPGEDGP